MSFARGRGNKLTGTFDPEALLRGPESASAALEREIERESRPRPFGGPGKVEMGAADDLLLPLALSAGALAASLHLRELPPRNWPVTGCGQVRFTRNPFTTLF